MRAEDIVAEFLREQAVPETDVAKLTTDIVRFFDDALERGDPFPKLPVEDREWGYRYDLGKEAGWTDYARWRWRANTWLELVYRHDER